MKKQFSIGEAIGYGWDTFKKNVWLFVGLAVVDLILNSLPNMAGENASPGKSFLKFVVFLVSLIVQIAVITIALRIVDSKKTGFEDFFKNTSCFWRYLGATILYFFIVAIGLILLIVPGIYWAVKYQFYGYLIVDKKLGIMYAMRKSGDMTKGVRFDLFVLGLTFIGVIILGAICLGVGLLAAIPVVWLATAYVYRKISKAGKSLEEPAEA